MILKRWLRTAAWILALGAGAAALFLVQIEDRAAGPFQARPAARAELRAPVAGFLRDVYYDEGDRVAPGGVVARLEPPDLASRVLQKRAEVRETRARLRLLEEGPRPEEVLEQRRRVERARNWRDLAGQDLHNARQALQEDLARLDEQTVQYRTELDYSRDVLERERKLTTGHYVSDEEYLAAEKQCRVFKSREEQAQAQKRARQALGAQEAEAELGRRDKELADAEGALALLEAGTRPEEVEAERARLDRLEEEARYLEGLQDRSQICSPVSGLVATPRLKEKVGQYLREGELICEVEEPAELEAEIALPEQDAARVRPGQEVELKVRALPYQTFKARVVRVAPRAVELENTLAPTVRGEAPGTVTVYCRLEGAGPDLLAGMTGYAHVACGPRLVGHVLADQVLRYVRTEFWW